ncbi:MAG TPA: hypothetical protein DCG32_04955 [Sphaerochaeta sp.]|nr:hypothetical protein [Sphaerochaeta sp.]
MYACIVGKLEGKTSGKHGIGSSGEEGTEPCDDTLVRDQGFCVVIGTAYSPSGCMYAVLESTPMIHSTL